MAPATPVPRSAAQLASTGCESVEPVAAQHKADRMECQFCLADHFERVYRTSRQRRPQRLFRLLAAANVNPTAGPEPTRRVHRGSSPNIHAEDALSECIPPFRPLLIGGRRTVLGA